MAKNCMTLKSSLGVVVVVFALCAASCAGQYDDESDFRAIPIDNSKSVRIIRYEGGKQIINIPPRMHGKPVTEIGEGVFKETEITSVSIPRNIVSIGKDAFNGCKNLSAVSFASRSRLQSIGDQAFTGCESLTGITIPKGVTSIGNGAFSMCKSLATVSFASGSRLQSIGLLAFGYCSFASITIPKNVTTIRTAVFAGCTNLINITVDAGNPQYTGEGGILWNKTKNELVAFPSARGVVTLPEGVTSISHNAFVSCFDLTGITLPESLTSIGNTAFAGCTNLTSVTIPAGITSAGIGTFSGWTSSQRINVRGHANRAAADRAWGTEWRQNCNATIVYGE